jgi:predicted DCC family thiol-disulfide oxidoreductase YuxK
MDHDHPVILFDGICNLCNRSVQFVIKRDKRKIFRFAPLQGKYGQQLLKKFQIDSTDLNSFVLVEGDRVYRRSSAALRVSRQLAGGWKLLYGLMIIPPFIRNGVYNLIARNRYKWFGKKNECMIPTPDLKSRFFD